MLDAELSVSTRPAALTAATSVDSAGLAEAAVATGAADIPVKLPAPDFGTAAQPGPKSIAVVAPAAEDDAMRATRKTPRGRTMSRPRPLRMRTGTARGRSHGEAGGESG